MTVLACKIFPSWSFGVYVSVCVCVCVCMCACVHVFYWKSRNKFLKVRNYVFFNKILFSNEYNVFYFPLFRNCLGKLYVNPPKEFCFLFFFLEWHLQHVEVSGLGVKSELQLQAYTTATTMPDPSHFCNLCHNLQQ